MIKPSDFKRDKACVYLLSATHNGVNIHYWDAHHNLYIDGALHYAKTIKDACKIVNRELSE